MLPWAVHLDPTLGTCISLGWQNPTALLSRDPCSGDHSHLLHLCSRPSRPQSLSRPHETRSAPPGQPRRPLPGGRQTRASLPCDSDAGLASASPCSLVPCLRATSSSWRQLHPLFMTCLPGAAFSCSYLASPHVHLPGAPAPLKPRWTFLVVMVAQPPPSTHRCPHPCAGPPGVASC
jgi:hypothetical protein